MSNESLKELLEFAVDFKCILEKKYQSVEVNQVIKNNDEMLVAVTVRDESNVAPNVYLNGIDIDKSILNHVVGVFTEYGVRIGGKTHKEKLVR